MKMKVRSFMMLLALAGLGVSCSNDDLTEGGETGTTGTRPEIQLSFSGTGESQEYERAARAIASESENKIDKLSVYLFAAGSQAGPYYYLETWEEGTAYDPTQPAATNFKKQESGTGWKASIYPNELKGLPYMKLLCVANNGVPTGSTTDGNFYEEDGKTALAALVKVTVDADGNVTNSAAATTEDAFRKAHTMNLGADAATGIIAAPLMMTGEGQTKISGSVSKVNIDLRRIMARFDIDNTTSRSNLTIQKITLARGRKCGALFGAAPTAVPKDDLDKVEDKNLVVKYQTVDFSTINGANKGLAESSLYAYPNLASDESYLIIEGTYKSPITSLQVPVTYNIPIARTPEGATEGEYIPVKANSRYKLRITDVTQSNIFGSFEVVDWTSGGGIDVKPNNDSPIFAGDAAFSGANAPKNLNAGNPEATTYDYEVTGTDGTGNFDIEIAATGKVRAEKGSVARANDPTDWLTIGTPSSEERDGVWYTKFNISYTGAIGQQPVAVTFINDAASYDPELWTIINFYGPKAVPSFAVVANGNSKGNVTDATNPKAPTAKIYKVKNSYVQFDVTSIEGITVATDTLGYTIKKVKTEGFVHTYQIAVKDEAIVTGGQIVFKNAADPSKTSSLTVEALDPSLKFVAVTTAHTAVTWKPGTETPFIISGELKIDLDELTSPYVFKLESPLGVSATNLASCPWLTINETHAWQDVDGQRYSTYAIIVKGGTPANTDDFTMIFNNNLSETNIEAPGIKIKAHKDYSKPKFAAGTTTASWSTWNVGLGTPSFTNPYDATIDMYMVNNSAITVTMTCTEAASFEAVAGLDVTKVTGSNTEYIVKVTDATQFTAGGTTELIAHNDGAYATDNATDRKAKLTITWKDPAITFEKTLDTANAATVTDDQIDVVGTTFADNYGTLKLKIKGMKGSTITVSDLTNTWAGAQGVVPAAIGDSGEAEITLGAVIAGNAADTADITITITNAITGGGDKTITISKK